MDQTSVTNNDEAEEDEDVEEDEEAEEDDEVRGIYSRSMKKGTLAGSLSVFQ